MHEIFDNIISCYLISENTGTTVLWRESLNSDGQQFYQYQQRNHSRSLIEHKKKDPWQGLGLGEA